MIYISVFRKIFLARHHGVRMGLITAIKRCATIEEAIEKYGNQDA
jgi:hypothetical protein